MKKFVIRIIVFIILSFLQSCASFNTSEQSVIVFYRTDNSYDFKVNLFIDGKNVGRINVDQTKVVKVSNGEHIIYNTTTYKEMTETKTIKVDNERRYIDVYLSLLLIGKNTPVENEKSIEEEVKELREAKSSRSSRSRTSFFSYKMGDINISINYNCSDSEAFSWTKYWITENFKKYNIRFEDTSLGLLSGSWTNEGFLADISSSFEFRLNNNNAVFKLTSIRSYSTSFSKQEDVNNYTELIINILTDKYKSFIQSK
jgi:hypothetical protein